MRGSRISGMGHYVPDRVVTNDDLAKFIDTSNEWIIQRTGIEERRWVEGDVGASDLAFEAAKDAIEEAGMRFLASHLAKADPSTSVLPSPGGRGWIRLLRSLWVSSPIPRCRVGRNNSGIVCSLKIEWQNGNFSTAGPLRPGPCPGGISGISRKGFGEPSQGVCVPLEGVAQ